MVLAQNRYKDQWNRIEDLDMNPHSYTQFIFDRVTKNIQWRKDNLFNKCYWEKWISACRKLKLDHAYHPVLVSTYSGLGTLISDPKP
jgi:hypothetical protein